MTWLLASPGHQQPWYWLCAIRIFLSPWGLNFNNLWCLQCQGVMWMQIYYIFSERFSTTLVPGLTLICLGRASFLSIIVCIDLSFICFWAVTIAILWYEQVVSIFVEHDGVRRYLMCFDQIFLHILRSFQFGSKTYIIHWLNALDPFKKTWSIHLFAMWINFMNFQHPIRLLLKFGFDLSIQLGNDIRKIFWEISSNCTRMWHQWW